MWAVVIYRGRFDDVRRPQPVLLLALLHPFLDLCVMGAGTNACIFSIDSASVHDSRSSQHRAASKRQGGCCADCGRDLSYRLRLPAFMLGSGVQKGCLPCRLPSQDYLIDWFLHQVTM